MDVLIEPMRREDLPEVLGIEAMSFGLPWTQEMFESDLDRGALADLLVARLAGAGVPPPVAGYTCVWVVGEELHINNLAVDPRWRRRGIASALLATILERGRERGARCAFLEVRASNAGAQALYRRFGFRPAGIRKGYYSHPPEDALIMRRDGV
ncbi:MAG TPA: ribosomal protein S18-alanine N-acetyltransferase [Candidatus Methylomirabilis sp.]|nr:ribosomal protein S18-alanine N-acetyltransferase [Candidatus Methylomirabilis sp.]